VDTALQAGDEITLHYDALVAKLLAWGSDRDEAIARLRRAVDEFLVAGIRTTLPFDRALLLDPDFVAGRLDIGFVERAMPRLASSMRDAGPEAEIAAIAAAVRATEEISRPVSREAAAGPGPWTLAGRRAQMEARLPRGH
jgi:acetyl/propionyl-CoA carboxylase alpha subunit